MTIDKNITILVAEDEYIVSEDIIRGLKARGYSNILEASNGLEAYEMCCSVEPDIIIMDIKMPKMDGLTAAKKIQEKCPTPIVIITAYESTDLVIEARTAGISAFLTKPTAPKEIERALLLALGRHSDLMEMRRLNHELETALAEIKRLHGILPICSSCKDIRDDAGYWQKLEAYIEEHSDVNFSHGICPECIAKLYPEYDD